MAEVTEICESCNIPIPCAGETHTMLRLQDYTLLHFCAGCYTKLIREMVGASAEIPSEHNSMDNSSH